MNKLPTERNILKGIYKIYEASYPGAVLESDRRENDPYIAIDIHEIAQHLGCKPELLFGQLYYHLDYKHRYTQNDGSQVPLFHLRVGGKPHAVNFPYLASILSGLNEEHRRQLWALGISIVALILSIVSLAMSYFKPQ